MDQAAVKSFYDERWAGVQYVNRLKLIRAATILELLSKTRLSEPTILDLGAGSGWLSNILGMYGPTVGVELSGAAVAAANQRYPHVQFVEADIREYTPPQPFDVVVAQEVLEHFEVHEQFVQCLSRLIRPGGYAILTTPNLRTLQAMREEQRRGFQTQPVENPVTMDRLKTLLDAQFEVLEAKTVVPGFGNVPLLYRLAHSGKLRRLLAKLWSPFAAESLSRQLGLGLHLAVLVRKR